MTANQAYLNLIQHVLQFGKAASPRQQATHEVIGNKYWIYMACPVITIPERELDYQFMAAEALWILTGNRRLDHPALRRNLEKYSDDGLTMRGAYGPPFIQQVNYVYEKLQQDPDSRQAVLTIWERNPRDSKDIPCTLSVQFLIRGDTLHTVVNMRSQDAWLGVPYDLFTFTMMTLYLNTLFGGKYKLGILTVMVGSQHIYERHLNNARALAGTHGVDKPIDSHVFKHPDALMHVLANARNASIDHGPNCLTAYLLCQ